MMSFECARCRREMFESQVDNLPCDVCPSCGGVWIDHRSLEAVVRKKVGPTGHDPLSALLTAAESRETTLACPRCKTGLRATTVDELTVDWCTSCRGVYLETGELQQVAEWRRHERRLIREADARETAIWLFDLADEAMEQIVNPHARWRPDETPEDELREKREAFFEILGEARPSRADPVGKKEPAADTSSSKPTQWGVFCLGWFGSRLTTVLLGAPEPTWLSRWIILGVGAALLASGIWLERPRLTPPRRLALYAIQAFGLMLLIEPVAMVRTLGVNGGTIVGIAIGVTAAIVATLLVRKAPRRQPPA